MPRWPWLEHTFDFSFPVAKFPEILERLRGTPARVAALIDGVSADRLTKTDSKGWSIQQNVGHLVDVHILMFIRLDELLHGAPRLTAPHEVKLTAPLPDHNTRPFADVHAELASRRADFVARLESCPEADWARAALHPRLNQPMRLVDHAFFFAEHDDYHLARVSEVIRATG